MPPTHPVRPLAPRLPLLLALLAACVATAPAGEPVRLVQVYDADTIRIARADGSEVNVRLIGVDAPEIQGKHRDAELGGAAASAFARRLLAVERIELEADRIGDDIDRYGRLLRYVRLPDGRDVGAEILAAGYARAYRRFTYTRKSAYLALEKQARQAGRGLWGAMGAGDGSGEASGGGSDGGSADAP